ncbi:glycosyltransferase family 2 protein [Desertifilum sp. FACHB-1129]|uniref:Glycosyl transferase family 2 n=1 Tax=Desertifilum tharense IPPAS B-1220 TaxID=1781255 RepID=A0A1E5QL90_9CYAN|nr:MULTISPECIES: glycosyltransferase family A protein [Desertifilum]MDA0212827.1 glycosyltransferase family A protein [Cyanobacteria bacterium FC1]MBD2314467.1 glycosyltransferase family 2 protein [Desertifilum sp. FACHB-1129]MBD2321716.1 glycosyltransferase family 2 protein [Desertifilum sp. FACHB-866]MBD2331843.1 glycosyltransferase family 2 protein [Desertifilum sp. FACHB-868]OEJ75371.1 glycosyl transferase family 2 [Desertifilum tharense IPPAS B-1220]
MEVSPNQLPRFSIILETENLANAEVKGLVRSLSTLAKQTLSPTLANEVILIESGDTPPDLLAQLCQTYPWIKVHDAPLGTRYYQAKMLGAKLATGDIVVYYDSDCLYEPTWLQTMLKSFTQNPAIQVVAGETATRGKGPYGTAMALVYIFPQFTAERALNPTSQYFLNNVAFRREFLLQHPIPTDLPLYRGNCVLHAQQLRCLGYQIWKQPQAKATHAPPNGLSHFVWRFLLIGYDYYWQKRLSQDSSKPHSIQNDPVMSGTSGKLAVLHNRLGRMFVNKPINLLYFPFALPIVFIALALIIAGYWITRFSPKYLLSTYNQILGEV